MIVTEPLGYLDFLCLEADAALRRHRFRRRPGGDDGARRPLLHPARLDRAAGDRGAGNEHGARSEAGAAGRDPTATRAPEARRGRPGLGRRSGSAGGGGLVRPAPVAMRVLILDTVYGAFLDSHYRSSPGLAAASYDEQWRALDGHALRHLRRLLAPPRGRVAEHELVVDVGPCSGPGPTSTGRRATETRWSSSRFAGSSPTSSTSRTSTCSTDASLLAIRSDALARRRIASEPPPRRRLRAFRPDPHLLPALRRPLPVARESARSTSASASTPGSLRRPHWSTAHGDAVFVGALNCTHHRRGNGTLGRAAAAGADRLLGLRRRAAGRLGLRMRRRVPGPGMGARDVPAARARRASALNRHIGVAAGDANNMRLVRGFRVSARCCSRTMRRTSPSLRPRARGRTYAGEDDLVEEARHYLAHEDERRAMVAVGRPGRSATTAMSSE